MNMRIKAIFLLLASALLTGCVAAVVAGAATGMIVYDKRNITTIERDARIFYKVHSKIVKDPEFKHSRILISSFNRVVVITGQTPMASLRMKAEKIAANTPDVYRVYNEMTIDIPLAYSQRTTDSWITSQVRSQMLTKKGLASGSIHVVTDDSVVYLTGIVSRNQANLAADVARRVSGVRKVVKIFQYI